MPAPSILNGLQNTVGHLWERINRHNHSTDGKPQNKKSDKKVEENKQRKEEEKQPDNQKDEHITMAVDERKKELTEKPSNQREQTRSVMADAAMKEETVESMPDVFLDVPTLKVDEIKLVVDDLEAQVALRAELANLVKINVGVNVGIKKVDLDIKGVDAQAVLKVRLKNVYAILSRALDTLDRNPEIVNNLFKPVGEAVKEAFGPQGSVKEAVHDVNGVAQETVSKAEKDAGNTAKNVTSQQGPISDIVKNTGNNVKKDIEGKSDVKENVIRYRFREDK